MNDKKRAVPKKNYVYLFVMMIMIVLVTFSIVNVGKFYQEKKLEKSYLYEFVSEVTLDEFENILTEPSSEMFVLVTRVNDQEVYNFEKGIKKVIKDRNLRDNFIYIDYTDKKDDLESLNKVLGSEISSLPAIIYYKNGVVVTSVDSSERLINAGDFEQILDSYEVN